MLKITNITNRIEIILFIFIFFRANMSPMGSRFSSQLQLQQNQQDSTSFSPSHNQVGNRNHEISPFKVIEQWIKLLKH